MRVSRAWSSCYQRSGKWWPHQSIETTCDAFSPITAEAIELFVNYLVIFTFLRHQYPAVAHILTQSGNIAFWPKLGFKNNFGLRPGSGLKMRPVYNLVSKSWSQRRNVFVVVPYLCHQNDRRRSRWGWRGKTTRWCCANGCELREPDLLLYWSCSASFTTCEGYWRSNYPKLKLN